MKSPLILLGSGGHARVLIDAVDPRYYSWLGYLDVVMRSHCDFRLNYLGNDSELESYSTEACKLVNGIGSVKTTAKRDEIYWKFRKAGFSFQTIKHSSAVVAKGVQLGEGCQIMAGAIIQSGAKCGVNVIVNTKASVDHDCVIGDSAHIAVGATLSGNVVVGSQAFVGAGSTVKHDVVLGESCIVAAGAVVVRDVPPLALVMGVPARVVAV